MTHPQRPGVTLILPDHRRHDVDPAIMGQVIELAGLTRERFRREVYGMEG